MGPTAANGQHTCSTGSVVKVPISFDHLHISLAFLVLESCSFDTVIGFFAAGATLTRLDSRLHQNKLSSGEKKATFFFEYAVLKERTDYELETDSEDFISGSDAAPDEADYSEQKAVIAYVESVQGVYKMFKRF